jgi:hypothetical protein
MPCVAYMTSHGYLVLAKYRCSDERMQTKRDLVMRVWLCTRQGKIHSNMVSDIACERIKVLGFQGALEASLG